MTSSGQIAAAKEAQERGEKENPRGAAGAIGMEVDPDYKGMGLQLQFTVEDEGAFTMPWSATITYRRALGLPRTSPICRE